MFGEITLFQNQIKNLLVYVVLIGFVFTGTVFSGIVIPIEAELSENTPVYDSSSSPGFEKSASNDADNSANPKKTPDVATDVRPAIGFAKPDMIAIEDNNISGGGFQSDVTVTEDGLTVYVSADVSGVFKSTDGGLRFESRNEGLNSTKVASIAITPDNPRILYAGTGNKGNSGGLFRSIDGGDTWTLTGAGAKAQFSGNHSALGDAVVVGHPRSNGNLIVVDEGENSSSYTDDIVLAGTYKNGVRFFTEGGDKEVAAVNVTGFVRALAHDSVLPDTVFAAIQFSSTEKSGIYRINYKNPAKPISTLVYATLRPEGLTVLSSGNVYGAIGSKGIVKYAGDKWTMQNLGLSVNNPNRQWTSVTGYVSGTIDIVYVGANNQGGKKNGSNYSNIWRSENGGSSWVPLVDANSNVTDTIYGQTLDWWFRSNAFPQAGLGRSNSVVSSLSVTPGKSKEKVDDDVIYVSGRGGVWKSANGGKLWQPAVNNMQATSNNDVAVNPNNPSQVVLANTDYVVLQTGSRYENDSLFRDRPRGSESKGYDVVFDVVADELILGVGNRDSNNPGSGEVFVKSASDLGTPSRDKWVSMGLAEVTSSRKGRVRAVSYGYHDGTTKTSKTILAAVENEGVFRFHQGKWLKSDGANIGSTDRSNFLWPDNRNSGVVYLLDLSIGLYRSNDGGRNWSNIWPGLSLQNNDFYNTGYITADDDNPTTLYVSILTNKKSLIGRKFKIYRLTQANTSIYAAPGTPGIVDISKHSGNSKILRPGPIVVAPDGRLWLAQQQDSKNKVGAGLFVMNEPATDTSFTDVTSEEYKDIAISPSGIDVASDGFIYVSQSGTGLVKIRSLCQIEDDC